MADTHISSTQGTLNDAQSHTSSSSANNSSRVSFRDLCTREDVEAWCKSWHVPSTITSVLRENNIDGEQFRNLTLEKICHLQPRLSIGYVHLLLACITFQLGEDNEECAALNTESGARARECGPSCSVMSRRFLKRLLVTEQQMHDPCFLQTAKFERTPLVWKSVSFLLDLDEARYTEQCGHRIDPASYDTLRYLYFEHCTRLRVSIWPLCPIYQALSAVATWFDHPERELIRECVDGSVPARLLVNFLRDTTTLTPIFLYAPCTFAHTFERLLVLFILDKCVQSEPCVRRRVELPNPGVTTGRTFGGPIHSVGVHLWREVYQPLTQRLGGGGGSSTLSTSEAHSDTLSTTTPIPTLSWVEFSKYSVTMAEVLDQMMTEVQDASSSHSHRTRPGVGHGPLCTDTITCALIERCLDLLLCEAIPYTEKPCLGTSLHPTPTPLMHPTHDRIRETSPVHEPHPSPSPASEIIIPNLPDSIGPRKLVQQLDEVLALLESRTAVPGHSDSLDYPFISPTTYRSLSALIESVRACQRDVPSKDWAVLQSKVTQLESILRRSDSLRLAADKIRRLVNISFSAQGNQELFPLPHPEQYIQLRRVIDSLTAYEQEMLATERIAEASGPRNVIPLYRSAVEILSLYSQRVMQHCTALIQALGTLRKPLIENREFLGFSMPQASRRSAGSHNGLRLQGYAIWSILRYVQYFSETHVREALGQAELADSVQEFLNPLNEIFLLKLVRQEALCAQGACEEGVIEDSSQSEVEDEQPSGDFLVLSDKAASWTFSDCCLLPPSHLHASSRHAAIRSARIMCISAQLMNRKVQQPTDPIHLDSHVMRDVTIRPTHAASLPVFTHILFLVPDVDAAESVFIRAFSERASAPKDRTQVPFSSPLLPFQPSQNSLCSVLFGRGRPVEDSEHPFRQNTEKCMEADTTFIPPVCLKMHQHQVQGVVEMTHRFWRAARIDLDNQAMDRRTTSQQPESVPIRVLVWILSEQTSASEFSLPVMEEIAQSFSVQQRPHNRDVAEDGISVFSVLGALAPDSPHFAEEGFPPHVNDGYLVCPKSDDRITVVCTCSNALLHMTRALGMRRVEAPHPYDDGHIHGVYFDDLSGLAKEAFERYKEHRTALPMCSLPTSLLFRMLYEESCIVSEAGSPTSPPWSMHEQKGDLFTFPGTINEVIKNFFKN